MGFRSFHPLVTFIYFIPIIVFTFLCNHPYFLIASITCAILTDIVLRGKKALRDDLILIAVIAPVFSIINGLFSHNGVTIIGYINNQRITLEAFIYGFISALLICAMIIWFKSFSLVNTQDRFLYLFGRILPSFAITLALIFRNIPLLRQRYHQIHEAQVSMLGAKYKPSFSLIAKELSILISWSLESSIETADYMTSRGYGYRGRTSFHLFKLKSGDFMLLMLIILLSIPQITGLIYGKNVAWYFPEITLPMQDSLFYISFISYLFSMFLIIIIQIYGELKWKHYASMR